MSRKGLIGLAAIAILIMLATPAMATISNVQVSDKDGDGVYFLNETIVVKFESNKSKANVTIYDGADNPCINRPNIKPTGVSGTNYTYRVEITLSNSSFIPNVTSDAWEVKINDTGLVTSSTPTYALIPVANIRYINLTTINNTTALQPNQAILKGDKIYINVTTEYFITPSNAKLYAVAVNATNYSDVMAKVQLSENESSPGNYTGVIDASEVGEWIILINNSIDETINKSVNFSIADLSVEVASGFIRDQTQQFFVKFNTVNKTGQNLTVSRTYNFTVTLGNNRPHDKFNYTYYQDDGNDLNITLTNNNRTAILTLYAGNYTVGNITLLNLSVSSDTAESNTVTIKCNETGETWEFTYYVQTVNQTITEPEDGAVFWLGQNITVRGIVADPNANYTINVTYVYPNGTKVSYRLNESVNGSYILAGFVGASPSGYNSTLGANVTKAWDNRTFEFIWFTNKTWNYTMLPVGKWIISIKNETYGEANVTIWIKRYLDVDVEQNSIVSKEFNVSVVSSRLNGTTIKFNVTATNGTKTVIVNNTMEGTLGNYSLVPKPSDVDCNVSNFTTKFNASLTTNLQNLSKLSWNKYDNGKYYVTLKFNVNDNTSVDKSWSDYLVGDYEKETKLWINITANIPSMVVYKQNITVDANITMINNTFLNNTLLVYLVNKSTNTIAQYLVGAKNLSYKGVSYRNAFYNNSTFDVYEYNATTGQTHFRVNVSTQQTGGGYLVGDYQVVIEVINGTNTLAKYVKDVTISTKPTVTVEYPESVYIDDIVWFNGTTNLADGTPINITIKKDNYILANGTVLNDTVTNGMFNISWQVNSSWNLTATFTKPETEYTVVFYYNNSTADVKICEKTIKVKDDIDIPDEFAIAQGDSIWINGTSTRVNNTNINITIFVGPTIYHTATVTVQNNKFSYQYDTDPLSVGTYTVKVDDGFVSDTATLKVETPRITIVTPEDGAKFAVGDVVWINGTTNREDRTDLEVTISGPKTFTLTTEAKDGVFNVSWDTSNNATGSYYISVKASDEKGISQTIQVQLVSPANVNIVDFVTEPAEITVGTPFKVNVTLNNTGGVDGTVTVTFKKDGVQFDSKDVTVPAGTTAYYVESNETSFDTAGVYNITVEVDGKSKTKQVEVLKPANISVTDFSLNVTEGIAPLAVEINATVVNTGDVTGNITVYFYVDGEEVYNKTVEVEAGATEYVTYVHTFEEAGTYNVSVNDLANKTVTVLKPATFELSNLTVEPTEGKAPLTIAVSVNVTNVGDVAGEYTVTLKVDGEEVANKTVTVNASETKTVSFEYTFEEAGTYNVTVDELTPVTVKVTPISPPPIDGHQPKDLNGDGLYEDVNGDGQFNFGDVVFFFKNFEKSEVQDYYQHYDFNGDGSVNFGDVIALFKMLP